MKDSSNAKELRRTNKQQNRTNQTQSGTNSISAWYSCNLKPTAYNQGGARSHKNRCGYGQAGPHKQGAALRSQRRARLLQLRRCPHGNLRSGGGSEGLPPRRHCGHRRRRIRAGADAEDLSQGLKALEASTLRDLNGCSKG